MSALWACAAAVTRGSTISALQPTFARATLVSRTTSAASALPAPAAAGEDWAGEDWAGWAGWVGWVWIGGAGGADVGIGWEARGRVTTVGPLGDAEGTSGVATGAPGDGTAAGEVGEAGSVDGSLVGPGDADADAEADVDPDADADADEVGVGPEGVNGPHPAAMVATSAATDSAAAAVLV